MLIGFAVQSSPVGLVGLEPLIISALRVGPLPRRLQIGHIAECESAPRRVKPRV
jgi:hypothetical protein